ncbi:ATP-binding protein [Pseudomonas oryzihabitans]|uniref:histidine kinase n=1 Tax=Pseudomonas oryzihabitans TaxID=47885 RepID=A0AAJ2EU95_9PSED|nr:transporter substrate-binding domain-containing protein [Pseudomonas psychrotolerans]MDR6232394.1 two-component system sensor histidine kinase EvgS [Pseudomonas psychrotolerans]
MPSIIDRSTRLPAPRCQRLLSQLLILLGLFLVLPTRATEQGNSHDHEIVVGLPSDAMHTLAFWKDGTPVGFSVDLLRDLASRLGLELKFRDLGNFEQALTALCHQQVDIVPDLLLTQARQRCMAFSQPYLRSASVLLVRPGTAPIDQANFGHFVFVAERGFATSEWLAQHLAPGQLKLYANTRAALAALQQGVGDAYLGEPYQLEALLRSTNAALEVRQQNFYANAELRLGVSLAKPALLQQLDHTLAQLPSQEVADLQRHWLDKTSVLHSLDPAHLTPQERLWLERLPPLRIGYRPYLRPLAFLDVLGKPLGLSSSYLEYFVRTLGLRTQTIALSAQDKRMASADDLDLLIPVNSAEEQHPGWVYTLPFVKIPNVLVTRQGEAAKTSIEESNGNVLAVPDAPRLLQLIQQRVPDSRLVPVQDAAEGLALVQAGKAYGYVGNLVSVDRLLESGLSSSLKIAAAVDVPMELSIAVAKRHAQLVPLLNRLIQNLTISQRDLFAQQWLRSRYEIGVPIQRLWRIVGGIALLSLLIIATLLYVQASLKARQRALREAEQRLSTQLRFSRELLDSYPYPVAVKDRRRRYLMINKAYERTFGVQAEAILGQSIRQVTHYPPALRQRIGEMASQALRDGERRQFEDVIRGSDGAAYHWLYIATPFRLDSCEPQGVLTTFIDVTDIRAAERQASRLKERLERITHNLPATVFEVRLQTSGDLQFTYVAGNLEALLDITPAALLSSPRCLSERIFAEDYPAVRAACLASMAAHTSCMASFRIGTPERYRWIRVEAAPWQTDQGQLTWAGVFLDITEARAYEEMLTDTKRLAEQAAAAKATFLATMSHEIRTPMNGIMGLLELMGHYPLPDDVRDMLVTSQESTRSLQQVLDDTLDFSRLESGKLAIVPQAVDLRSLIDSVLRLIAPQAQAKGLAVECRVDRHVAGRLEVDGSRLRQVLLNMLSNATKFTTSGTLSFTLEVCATEAQRQSLLFGVQDTGIGISAEQQQRLFQPFVQADNSVARRYGGSGLGLMISRQLIHLMGGDLQLSSQLGQGTRVEIRLDLPVVEPLHPPFSGRSLQVAHATEGLVSGLEEHLAALGLRRGAAPADLLLSMAGGPEAGVQPTLFITREVIPIGYAVTATGVQLSVNPLTWSATRAALDLLLDVRHGAAANLVEGHSFAGSGRLLVVEDHPTNRLLLERQLQHLGCTYELVENGKQALDCLEGERYALILTDCYMPVLDGYALARRVRALPSPLGAVPIIGMTASILPREQERAQAAGMDELLLKPVSLSVLITLLERFLTTQPTSSREGVDPAAPPPRLDLAAGLRAVMLQSFLEETAKDLPTLEAAVQRRDSQVAAELLHKFAGGLRLMEKHELADEAQRHQGDATAGQLDRGALDGFIAALRQDCGLS